MSDTERQETSQVVEETQSTSPEPKEPIKVGSHTGQVRMFNRFRGYGFISVHGEENLDVFVHQTNICPLNNTYRTLMNGEYVSLDISDDEKRQALNVRGVGGGPLRCDAPRRPRRPNPRYRNRDDNQSGGDGDEGEFQRVESRGDRRRGRGKGRGGGRNGSGGRGRRNGESDDRYSDRPRERGVNLNEFVPSE